LALVLLLNHTLHLTQEHQEEVIQVLKQLHQQVVEMVVTHQVVVTQETLEDQVVVLPVVVIIKLLEQVTLLQQIQIKVALVVLDQEVVETAAVAAVVALYVLDLLLIQEVWPLEELEVDFQMLWVLQVKAVVLIIILQVVEQEVETIQEVHPVVED
jgi:uncharacterized membrane protein YqjE